MPVLLVGCPTNPLQKNAYTLQAPDVKRLFSGQTVDHKILPDRSGRPVCIVLYRYFAYGNARQKSKPGNRSNEGPKFDFPLAGVGKLGSVHPAPALTMISPESLSVSLSAFTLISLAEIGDKSQLVCMTLAARHRHWPVLLGASTAFVILNTLAVLFGAGVAAWVPERMMAGIVAVLFGAFGIHALRSHGDDDAAEVIEKPGHGIFFTTLLLILVAEFGDKTQIAVAGLSGSLAPLPVWIGATAALVMVSALGVWAGRTLLQRLPLHWLHRVSGGIFLVFALIAAWRATAMGE